MVTLSVNIFFEEEVLGTANSNPEIHQEYIASKAPDSLSFSEEVAAIGTEEAFEKSMTVFPRLSTDKNVPIAWDYQWKGFLKDAFKALKKVPGSECSKIKAYKQEIDGLIFVTPRQIPFVLPEGGEISICQRPLRASTPQGERVALASSESIPAGSTMEFQIKMLLPSHEKAVIEALEYGVLRGFGQWRNSGKGRFRYEILKRED